MAKRVKPKAGKRVEFFYYPVGRGHVLASAGAIRDYFDVPENSKALKEAMGVQCGQLNLYDDELIMWGEAPLVVAMLLAEMTPTVRAKTWELLVNLSEMGIANAGLCGHRCTVKVGKPRRQCAGGCRWDKLHTGHHQCSRSEVHVW